MSYCIVIDKRKIIGGLYLKITGKGKGKENIRMKIYKIEKNLDLVNDYSLQYKTIVNFIAAIFLLI
ncbi:hypothetical protein SVR5_00130 [Glaesserella parasuis 29755]|nr:hypothetical protein A4U84_01240 [Glaesserella parasuis]ATW43047.1 hypothetical protein A2U20_04185 [Glaesserella parasuis D74]AWY45879.1 hypothetical protein B4U42_07855 [Glaesserella parasuis 29755]KDB50115.1 hypothetical protein HPS11_00750 [Glaesserella parasuis HPS11]OIT25955.1 hypothetical protein BLL93_00690 [Glaesserella parasuis]